MVESCLDETYLSPLMFTSMHFHGLFLDSSQNEQEKDHPEDLWNTWTGLSKEISISEEKVDSVNFKLDLYFVYSTT